MPDNPDAAAHAREDGKKLRSLLELSRVLARVDLGLDTRLQELVKVLARLAKAEKCSLMLAEGGRLEVRAATNRGLVGLQTPTEQLAVSTEVLRSGKAVCLANIAESPFAALGRHGDASSYRTGSFMCLPLKDDGVSIGVLNLSDKRGQPHFDDDDLFLAQAMADQVAVLISFSAMHQRLDQAYQDLRRGQRAKEELMNMLFHDMKAPLTALKEVLRLLAADKLAPQERGRYLALAGLDTEQLWRRVCNLLDLSRMEDGQMPLRPAPLRPAQLAAEVMDGLSSVAGFYGVSARLQAQADPEIVADEDLTERILQNILVNALKFSAPENGGGGQLEVRVDADERFALIEVRDSGPGVDAALAQTLFQRYAHGGGAGSSGLGLYFCRRAAWLLGGEIAYRNTPDGASFVISLPLEGGR